MLRDFLLNISTYFGLEIIEFLAFTILFLFIIFLIKEVF